jgi:serine/threonine-protein kinase
MNRIETLFHRALKLEVGERELFLADLRGSDPGLANEVESLISAHFESENPVGSPAYQAAASLIVNQTEDLTGRWINQYCILGRLGRGGMGEVYRARDTRLNREVALKVLTETFVNGIDRLNRFRREAQVLASLNHPNIAGIHDLLESEGKQVLVLELVEGPTLADRLRQGPLPLAEALTVALKIAEALQSAHKKGIIHRDLKPANIKIRPDGEVRVLDFGLAKQVQGSGAESESQAATWMHSTTVKGVILGTPGYMSPEQAVGEQADIRSDVFSFGAVVYEMLTRRRAFSGDTMAALLQSVLTANPVSPKRLRPEIPADLDAAVMTALSKDRDERQQDMNQLCSLLSRLTTSVSQQSSRRVSPAIEWWSNAIWRSKNWSIDNKRTVFSAIILALLLVLGSVGWWAFQQRRHRGADSVGSQTYVNSGASAYELFEQGLKLLERYDKRENIDEAVQAFNAALAKEETYAPAYAGLGLAYAVKFQFNRDSSLLDLAVHNALRSVQLNEQLAISRVSLGRGYVARKELDLAEAELKQAVVLESGNSQAYRGLADLEKARNNVTEAERHYKTAIELRPDDWDLHFALGTFLYGLSRYKEAENAFNKAGELAPDCYMVHRNLGAVYNAQGRFAEASAAFQKSLQISPNASVYSNLGTSLFFQGLYQESVAAMEKAVELGANNYQTWANLGDAYRQMPGKENDAREAFQTAAKLVRDLSPKPNDAELQSRLAVYLAKIGEHQAALNLARVVEGLKTNPAVLARLVLVYEICGRRAQALNSLAAALEQKYSLEEIKRDPDLLEMRKDPNYHKLVVRFSNRPTK